MYMCYTATNYIYCVCVQQKQDCSLNNLAWPGVSCSCANLTPAHYSHCHHVTREQCGCADCMRLWTYDHRAGATHMVKVFVNCSRCVVFVVAIEGKSIESSCHCTGGYTISFPGVTYNCGSREVSVRRRVISNMKKSTPHWETHN